MLNFHVTSKRAERTALDIVWEHWGMLGYTPPPTGALPKKSLVDPEALLLLSLYLLPADERLGPAVVWWAESCAPLCSIQRIKRLLPLFPNSARKRLAEWAAPAAASRDPRWGALANARSTSVARSATTRAARTRSATTRAAPTRSDSTTQSDSVARSAVRRRPVNRARPPLILGPAALVLRGRLLFGVNPRADVIVYLLSRGTQTASVTEIASTTVYARSSIYKILAQLQACRLAARMGTRPRSYVLCADAWREVFGREVVRDDWTDRFGFRRGYQKKTAARMWLCWPQVFSVLALLRDVGCEDSPNGISQEERVANVFRACFEYQRTFFGHGLKILPYHGLDPRRLYLLDESVDTIVDWYRSHS